MVDIEQCASYAMIYSLFASHAIAICNSGVDVSVVNDMIETINSSNRSLRGYCTGRFRDIIGNEESMPRRQLFALALASLKKEIENGPNTMFLRNTEVTPCEILTKQTVLRTGFHKVYYRTLMENQNSCIEVMRHVDIPYELSYIYRNYIAKIWNTPPFPRHLDSNEEKYTLKEEEINSNIIFHFVISAYASDNSVDRQTCDKEIIPLLILHLNEVKRTQDCDGSLFRRLACDKIVPITLDGNTSVETLLQPLSCMHSYYIGKKDIVTTALAHYMGLTANSKIIISIVNSFPWIDQVKDIHLSSKANGNILHLATLKGRMDIVEYLIRTKKDRVVEGLLSTQVVRTSLIDASSTDSTGRTALHIACEDKYGVGIVSFLLSRENTSVNSVDNNCDTPLHIACKRGYKNICISLIDAGASENISNKSGAKPLSLCDSKKLRDHLDTCIKDRHARVARKISKLQYENISHKRDIEALKREITTLSRLVRGVTSNLSTVITGDHTNM